MKRNLFKPVFTFFGVFIIAILFRVLVFDIYSIPSSSMENTLLPGDKVFVNKLIYGPKLPASPYDIPWVNLFWIFRAGSSGNNDSVYWNYHRINGFGRINRNEVMVFTHPLSKKRQNYFIKRCMALPGDTIEIKDGKVIINGNDVTEQINVKKKYHIWTKQPEDFYNIADSLELSITGMYLAPSVKKPIELLLSTEFIHILAKMEIIDSLKVSTTTKDSIHRVYPKVDPFFWTIDNYGPLVIPYKGMEINLNYENVTLYRRTINKLEGVKLIEKNGQFFVEGLSNGNYVFQHDYFFMMGDNRHGSMDSRFWGLIPEENIVGKATLVLFNFRFGNFTWERLLKRIE